MHTHKVGGLCPVNVNHSNTLILGVDAPHVALRAIALHVELRAYTLTR